MMAITISRAGASGLIQRFRTADKDGNISQDEIDGFIQRRGYQDLASRIVPNVMMRGQS